MTNLCPQPVASPEVKCTKLLVVSCLVSSAIIIEAVCRRTECTVPCQGNMLYTQHIPRNMPDLICIWSRLAQKHWPEAGPIILAHRLLLDRIHHPFGQNLTVSQNQIESRLVLYSMIWAVCGRNQQSFETGSRLMAFCQNQAWWFLHTGLLPDEMHLAKTWPGRPDQIWASFARYDLGLLWKNGTKLDARTEPNWMQEVRSSIYNPAGFWLHAGLNWP